MKFIKINYKDFSKYTLTHFFYIIQPNILFYKGNVLKIICNNEPFSYINFKILKDIGTLKGYQILPIKEINNNFYTSLNKK